MKEGTWKILNDAVDSFTSLGLYSSINSNGVF